MDPITIATAALTLAPGIWQFIVDLVNHNRAAGRTTLTPEQEQEIIDLELAEEAEFDARVADAKRRLGMA
jgi:hypothetical protein